MVLLRRWCWFNGMRCLIKSFRRDRLGNHVYHADHDGVRLEAVILGPWFRWRSWHLHARHTFHLTNRDHVGSFYVCRYRCVSQVPRLRRGARLVPRHSQDYDLHMVRLLRLGYALKVQIGESKGLYDVTLHFGFSVPAGRTFLCRCNALIRAVRAIIRLYNDEWNVDVWCKCHHVLFTVIIKVDL